MTARATTPGSPRERLRVAPGGLRRHCDAAEMGFSSTAEVAPLEGAIGQERALRALEFALGIEGRGYNAFATGPIGAGKESTLEARLREAARSRPTPSDTVYLPNFQMRERPLCATLPAGRGQGLADAMVGFLADVRRRIPEAFESESYQRRRTEAVGPLEHDREAALEEVKALARTKGVDLELTPAGIATRPLVEGKAVTRQQFDLLPESMQAAFLAAQVEVVEAVGRIMGRIRDIEVRAQQRIDELNREVVLFAIGHLVEELKRNYGDVSAIADWLDRVREDVINNYSRFLDQSQPQLPAVPGRDPMAGRYAVNVFVSHEGGEGAPVVVERSPTFQSLLGRIEYETTFGAAVTDHNHVKAGAIHRANGGFLLLHADDLLTRPFLWDKLKQILRTGKAPVENLADQYFLVPSATLTPEPVPTEVKVILLGSPALHGLLYELDEELRELFRVKIDFDVEMPWSAAGVGQYTAFIGGEVSRLGLLHFDPEAVAAIVEEGARRAGDQEKLSTRLGEISDLVAQASHWARQDGAELVGPGHVARAIAERDDRSNLVEQKIDEAIARDTLHIEVGGSRVGQVNGLAVSEVGGYLFGHPVRITASTSPGDGRMVSIEREAKLSGHVHDKGFLTLRGFLEQRYGRLLPLSLSANLTFEQSYGAIDGDSAAGAELSALLSSLSGAPVDQQVALTGSIDQRGRLQAVGAVTEKVEAFFKACEREGLTGEQGVIVPAANLRHLMLSPAVVEAVAAGRFHVWTAETIDDVLELLTGVPAGEPGPDGSHPDGSLHRRVEDRLGEMGDAIRSLAGQGQDGPVPTRPLSRRG